MLSPSPAASSKRNRHLADERFHGPRNPEVDERFGDI
jgi:hypothetical protein